MTAAIRAVRAGYRWSAAIAEWVADIPIPTALAWGIDPDRRLAAAMIRRRRRAPDPDLRTAAIGGRRAARAGTAAPAAGPALAVDGQTLRGSRTAGTAARQVVAAGEQATGIVRARTGVHAKTHELTRFRPLLDQIGDRREAVITVDAPPGRREHVACLAERGAGWVFTVEGHRPAWHAQPAALPWRAVPEAARDGVRGHGRREIRTLKMPGPLGFGRLRAEEDQRCRQFLDGLRLAFR